MVSGTADPHRTIFLGDVRDDNDLRVAGHAPAFPEYIEFDLAEAAGERNLLRRSETLIVTLPLGWRIAPVRVGTAFWNGKGGPGVSQLCGNK